MSNALPCPAALLLLALTGLVATAAAGARDEHPMAESRQTYLAARDALARRQYDQFRALRQQLQGYALAPYLDYFYLYRRLPLLPENDVGQFLSAQRGTLLESRLRQRWLHTLADRGQWQTYLHYYRDDIRSTSLACRALQARLESGDRSALDRVAPLWNVGHSQPNDCDELFEQWIAADRISPELAWQRFVKAMAAGNRTLGNYLTRFLEGHNAELAALQIEVGRYPHRIARHSRFQQQSAEMQAIILYGIRRYARQDPLAAYRAWQHYDAQQLFDHEQRQDIQQHLAIHLLRRGHQQAVEALIADIPRISSTTLTEILIVDALKQQDWSAAHRHILSLPEDQRQSERWLYWRARALAHIDGDDPDYDSARQIYSQLAMQRDFYAFLAADRLGRDYYLGDRPSRISSELLLAIGAHPAAQRARELLAVGDNTNASREWLFLSRQFDTEAEHIAAARLAQQWGWHNKAIISLASARSWDDLQMRFPLAYDQHMQAAAERHRISPLLLFAIARQESAFSEQARSPAGALGLMQLMPATAKQTARRAGIDYRRTWDLLSAEKNIKLGSYYINELLGKYNGNRILATAAYNAGPHRVDRWLRNSASQLPFDIWIESIPFRETRKYVQNVLAYQVIYGYRTGSIPAMVSDNEARQAL